MRLLRPSRKRITANLLPSFAIPSFYKWGGGGVPFKWSLGWLTGIDGDLVCVIPNVHTRIIEHRALSPVCSNAMLAIIAMIFKAILLKIDYNLKN